MERLRMNQAIAEAMRREMLEDPDVILLGEDVADAQGVFKTSEGLLAEFGADRVLDTPISEMGFLGAALGAAVSGLRPVVEIMFVEFLGVAIDQLSTGAAKMRYLSGGDLSVPMVVRASIGAGAGFGCQHSQTLETWFAATPGITLCEASGARAAYGLLRAAIRSDSPVVVLEPRVLYGSREAFDPDTTTIELGRAEIIERGTDVTLVGLGQTVTTASKAVADSSWSADVIDLLTLYPWDVDTVLESVGRTGRLVVVEESPYTGGWGADIVSEVSSCAFSDLKAPPMRITAPDIPVPFGVLLEKHYLPSPGYVDAQVTEYLATDQVPQPWWQEMIA